MGTPRLSIVLCGTAGGEPRQTYVFGGCQNAVSAEIPASISFMFSRTLGTNAWYLTASFLHYSIQLYPRTRTHPYGIIQAFKLVTKGVVVIQNVFIPSGYCIVTLNFI